MKNALFLSLIILFSFSSCATRVVTPTPQTKVVVVNTPPSNHKVVVIKGKRYYKWNGRHYRKTRKGYVVVTL